MGRSSGWRAKPLAPSLPALLLTLLAGCGGHNPTLPSPVQMEGDVALIVNNHTYNDFNIYAVHDGQSSLVGQAVASTTATLIVRRSYVGQSNQLSLHGAPIGGNRRVTFQQQVFNAKPVNSEVVTLQPGMMMEWTLESDLTKSALRLH
jgi:hypothetical protein